MLNLDSGTGARETRMENYHYASMPDGQNGHTYL